MDSVGYMGFAMQRGQKVLHRGCSYDITFPTTDKHTIWTVSGVVAIIDAHPFSENLAHRWVSKCRILKKVIYLIQKIT